jgi:GNAT superfamily N-acetyltransferase
MKRPRERRHTSAEEPVFHPLTADRWGDLERLFGERGACGGCWCMFWRRPRRVFAAQKGAGNRRAFRRLVASGPPPGILAYVGSDPAGWCALAPREAYSSLARSRVLAPVDDRPVWSVTCFFVARPHRRSGLSVSLLRAAVDHARRRGARIVEGYPVEPKKGAMPDAFAWTGLASAFRAAGFHEALRRSASRPIMRRRLDP